jgi:hypothetical protein
MRLADLNPLGDVPGVTLVSLQKGAASQIFEYKGRGPLLDLGKEISDYADTAAIIKNLDVLITVDTSVAHLPGAMGAFMSWEKFTSITNRFFPSIRILHPLPCHRFDARTRGKSPVR